MENKINDIAVFEKGSRKALPVVLIHGFPLSSQMWVSQISSLSQDYHVISYDVRGHGQSESGDGQYSIELFVDDLLSVMDHLKIPSAVLCGLSMGGYIALRAVERHPERIKGLILCDTKSEADSNEAKIKRAATVQSVKKNGVAAFANEFVRSVMCEDTFKARPELVEAVLNIIRKNTPLGICGALLAMAARTDTTPVLSKVTVPTLILAGEQDKLIPVSVAQSMAKAVSGAQFHVIPKAAHLSNLENPDFFNERLNLFLKTIKI